MSLPLKLDIQTTTTSVTGLTSQLGSLVNTTQLNNYDTKISDLQTMITQVNELKSLVDNLSVSYQNLASVATKDNERALLDKSVVLQTLIDQYNTLASYVQTNYELLCAQYSTLSNSDTVKNILEYGSKINAIIQQIK